MMEGMNPLLQMQFRVPFDDIRAEHVEPAVGELLRDARARVEALADDADPLTGIDELGERLGYAMSVVSHLESVATYPELRAAYNAVQPKVSAFYSSIPLNEGLWKSLQRYAGIRGGGAVAGHAARGS